MEEPDWSYLQRHSVSHLDKRGPSKVENASGCGGESLWKNPPGLQDTNGNTGNDWTSALEKQQRMSALSPEQKQNQEEGSDSSKI